MLSQTLKNNFLRLGQKVIKLAQNFSSINSVLHQVIHFCIQSFFSLIKLEKGFRILKKITKFLKIFTSVTHSPHLLSKNFTKFWKNPQILQNPHLSGCLKIFSHNFAARKKNE